MEETFIVPKIFILRYSDWFFHARFHSTGSNGLATTPFFQFISTFFLITDQQIIPFFLQIKQFDLVEEVTKHDQAHVLFDTELRVFWRSIGMSKVHRTYICTVECARNKNYSNLAPFETNLISMVEIIKKFEKFYIKLW